MSPYVIAGLFGLAGSVIGSVTTLFAAYANQRMTRKEQHRRWLLERKQDECRELLSALSGAYVEILRIQPMVPLGQGDHDEIFQAKIYSLRTFRDRIYLAKDLDLIEMSNLWVSAMDRQSRISNPPAFQKTYDELCNRVRDVMLQSL